MSTPIENNTAGLQEILQQVNELPEGVVPGNAVLYTEQALTPEQQSQARDNIGASPVNIYTGPNEPTDENIQIWVNPDEEPENVPSKTVQTDWNQTDETAPDFLKNKPFGDEEVIVIEEQTYVPNETDGAMFNALATIEVGAALTVVYDDVTYKCIVFDFSGMNAFGNSAFFGGADTGEPFAGIFNGNVMILMDMDASVNHTISISATIATKIPSKFVAVRTLFYAALTNAANMPHLYSDANMTTKCTKAELYAAMQMGLVMVTQPGLGAYFYAAAITFEPTSDYAEIQVFRGLTGFTFYTAEYTP